MEDKPPTGVPAVYNLYNYLGNSNRYTFRSIIYNRKMNRKKLFPNGSIIELRKFNLRSYYLWKFVAFFKLFFWGNHILKEKKYDCVYGLSTFSTIAALLGRIHKIKSIGRIFGTILTKLVKEKKYLILFTRYIFDIISIKIPASIVIATKDGTDYNNVFYFFNKRKKINLLFNGIEKNLRIELLKIGNIEKLPEKGTIKFGYLARLESYKRQELAIDLVDELVNSHNRTNILLTIVGNGSLKNKLVSMVEEKKLNSYINFMDEIEHVNIPSILRQWHASLFFYEGGNLGNTLWESALAGRLIITISTGGTGEIIKDGKNGLILPDNYSFTKDMAIRINQLIGKDILNITSHGRKTAEHLIKPWEERFDQEFDGIFN